MRGFRSCRAPMAVGLMITLLCLAAPSTSGSRMRLSASQHAALLHNVTEVSELVIVGTVDSLTSYRAEDGEIFSRYFLGDVSEIKGDPQESQSFVRRGGEKWRGGGEDGGRCGAGTKAGLPDARRH